MNAPLALSTVAAFLVAAVATRIDAARLVRAHPDLSFSDLQRRPGAAWVIAPLGLLCFAVTFALRLNRAWAWQLPPAFEIALPALVYGALGAVIGCLAGLLATPLPGRPRRPLPLVVAVFALVLALQWHNERRLEGSLSAGRLRDERTPDGIILQTSGASCAAASGANIARLLGRETNEREAARAMRTRTSGTSPARVLWGMGELGFEGWKFFLQPGGEADLPLPAMLFVDHPATGPESHAVAAVRWRQPAVELEVWDPLIGRLLWTPDQLWRTWAGRGITFARREGDPPSE